ncbi:MAG: C40 family peptidase [Salinivirgaceae bacterium]|nr:C40 family peptidase [Salinivirgaceae bacterium]
MKKTGISIYTLIAVRSNPSERAEMVTQLLFGETFIIEEEFGNWARIISLTDHYEGWIDRKLVTYLNEEELNLLSVKTPIKSSLPLSVVTLNHQPFHQPLVAGSILPISGNGYKFTLSEKTFSITQIPERIAPSGENIIKLAQQFINAPYLWGGKSILGMDCSGLTQLVYGITDVQLPRDASKQIATGKPVNFVGESKPGDLAFFDNENGDIVHVGIIMDTQHIIHASGSVRVDSIDHQGIFNQETNRYSHKLRIIKRIID